MNTAHEEYVRYRKATRIADVLQSFASNPEDVEMMSTDGRRAAEQLAMVRTASDRTWAVVVDILKARAQVRELMWEMASTDGHA